jgi:enoyl-CoA hydratase/carnithine racemase
MSVVELKREGDVFILTMARVDNRFNPSFMEAMNQALDTVEQSKGPAALVTTGGEEKFYSNGLDLEWLRGDGRGEQSSFIASVAKLFARVLSFPVPTVAAINGHAFASGALLALAHDFRIMRAERGFICMPEVDIKIPLAPGLLALIKARAPAAVFRDLVLTGVRVGGNEAKGLGIVDEAMAKEEVLPKAIALAAFLANKDRNIYQALKQTMYGEVAAMLENDTFDLARYL